MSIFDFFKNNKTPKDETVTEASEDKSQEDLVPVFIPALSVMLINLEDKKGEPLTQEEVLEIRDNASCIMMTKTDAEKMAKSREYLDIDPENCWYDWQMLRRELNRMPDLDPGVRCSYTPQNDAGMESAIKQARKSVHEFRSLYKELPTDYISPLVKVLLTDNEYSVYVWLYVSNVSDISFEAELFEVPVEVTSYKAGDSFTITDEEIVDWMINDNGTLYGGYTLRYQRETMSDSEREAFDEHVGIKELA